MLPSSQITHFLLIVFALSLQVYSFQFRELQVTAASLQPSATTTYQFIFNRTINNNLKPTNWLKSPLLYNSTVVVIFPPSYSLLLDIICSYSINSTIFFYATCVVQQNQITLSNLFEDMMNIATFSLVIENMGHIGDDVAVCEEKTNFTIKQMKREIKEIKSKNNLRRNLGQVDMLIGSVNTSSNLTSATDVTYSFSFTVTLENIHLIFIDIRFPNSLIINQFYTCNIHSDTYSTPITCQAIIMSTYYKVRYSISYWFYYMRIGSITLDITHVTNPPTTAPLSFPTTLQLNGLIIFKIDFRYNLYVPSNLLAFYFYDRSTKNGEITTYPIYLQMRQTLPSQSLIYLQFPNTTSVQSSSTCQPQTIQVSSKDIEVTIIGNLFKIRTLVSIPAFYQLFLNFTHIRNALTFQPSNSVFNLSIKTADDAYYYNYAELISLTSNSIPSLFKSIDFVFKVNNTNLYSLAIAFEISQSEQKPAYCLLRIPPMIILTAIICTQFINWNGNCIYLGNNILKMEGNFYSGEMKVKISLSAVSIVFEYFTLASYTSANFKIDESSADIINLQCSSQCKTCNINNHWYCSSCHTSLLISDYIYFFSYSMFTHEYWYDTPSSFDRRCLTSCPNGFYSSSMKICITCENICLTCSQTSSFCTSCYQNGSYPYLNVSSITQTCVDSCEPPLIPVSGRCICINSFMTYLIYGKRCQTTVLFPIIFSICGLVIVTINILSWIFHRKWLLIFAIRSQLGLLEGVILIRLCILMVSFEESSLWYAIVECLVFGCILNITTVLFLDKSMFRQIDFKKKFQSRSNKIVYTFISLVSLFISHKFMGLLCSSCFELKVFSLRIKDSQFQIFILSSLTSMVLTVSVIIIAALALNKNLSPEQSDCCIDAIALFSGNLIFSCLSMQRMRVKDEQISRNHLEESTNLKIEVKHQKSDLYPHSQMKIESRA